MSDHVPEDARTAGSNAPGAVCHRPLDAARAAWVLIRRFGTAATEVATGRAIYCDTGGRPGAAAEWRYVRRKVVEFLDDRPGGRTLV